MLDTLADYHTCTAHCHCCWKRILEKPITTGNYVWDMEVTRRAKRLCEIVCYGIATPSLSDREQESLFNHCGFSIWRDIISNN
jgi:hypothetical protein